MRKWFCDGCELEFGDYSDAQYKSRIEIKSIPEYAGTAKLFFCKKCSEQLLKLIRTTFPNIKT
jgi:hypothetical protein